MAAEYVYGCVCVCLRVEDKKISVCWSFWNDRYQKEQSERSYEGLGERWNKRMKNEAVLIASVPNIYAWTPRIGNVKHDNMVEQEYTKNLKIK